MDRLHDVRRDTVSRRIAMRYRRDWRPGGTYFFTVVTHRRRPILTCEPTITILRRAVAEVRRAHPFTIDAFVVLPDHLHAIWTLPDGDCDYALRWNRIKGEVSRNLPHDRAPPATVSRRRKRERAIWQRRFWEHRILDDADFARLFDYVHFNPVKHGLVGDVRDWPHSTFHAAVQAGRYPIDWLGEGSPEAPPMGMDFDP
jgi:putative transposase